MSTLPSSIPLTTLSVLLLRISFRCPLIPFFFKPGNGAIEKPDRSLDLLSEFQHVETEVMRNQTFVLLVDRIAEGIRTSVKPVDVAYKRLRNIFRPSGFVFEIQPTWVKTLLRGSNRGDNSCLSSARGGIISFSPVIESKLFPLRTIDFM